MSSGPYDPTDEFVDGRDDDDTDLSDYDAGVDESPDVNDTVDVDELAHDTPPTWDVDETPENDEHGWSYWWECDTGDRIHADKEHGKQSYHVEHLVNTEDEYRKLAEGLPSKRDAVEVAIGSMETNKCVPPGDHRARAREYGEGFGEMQSQARADRRAELDSRKLEDNDVFEERNRLPDAYDPVKDIRSNEDTVYDPSVDLDEVFGGDVPDEETQKEVLAEEGSDQGDEDDVSEPVEVEFGAKGVADSYRDEHEEYLFDEDDRRRNTVLFAASTPDDVVEEVRAAATETRADKTKDSYGQTELTEREKSELDFSETDIFTARTAKAIAAGEGVSNWLDYYDSTLTTDEHIEAYRNAEAASRLDSNELDDETVDEKLAEFEKTVRSEECDHAESGCRDGYEEACEFLTDECGVEEDRVDELLDEDDSEGVDVKEVELDDDEIPVGALSALRRAWTGYRAGRAKAKEGEKQGVEEARSYAAIINAVRESLGQDLLEFESAGEFDGGVVDPDEVGVEFEPESEETVSASSFAPYDPTEEI